MAIEHAHRTQRLVWLNASPTRNPSTATAEPAVASIVAALGRDVPTESDDLSAANSFWVIEAGSPSTTMLRFALGHDSDADGKNAFVKIFGVAPEGPELATLDSSAKGVWTPHWLGTISIVGGAADVHSQSWINPSGTAPTSLKWVDTPAVVASGALEPGVRLVFKDGTGTESDGGIASVQFDRTGFSYLLVAAWCYESEALAGDACDSVVCQYANLGG